MYLGKYIGRRMRLMSIKISYAPVNRPLHLDSDHEGAHIPDC